MMLKYEEKFIDDDDSEEDNKSYNGDNDWYH